MEKKISIRNCSCQCCRKNWKIVRQRFDELENKLHRVQEGMEIEIVSSDKKKQSTIAFRQMEL